jgi:nicotinamidase/pyrazinamidase
MKALIVVDIQNDFCPGGSLPVLEGDKIIPVINNLLPNFDLIIFTKDWHPQDHKSFASNNENINIFSEFDLNGSSQVAWPDHCIQNTFGSDFHRDLDFGKIKKDFYIFKKGMDPEVDSYSAFYDNGKKNSTGLSEFMKERNVTEIFICGLALDFCVSYTAIDSALEGFESTVIIDACRSINPDINPTIQKLLKTGINII